MRVIYFLLIFSLLFTQSCTSDDNSEPQPETNLVEGTWNLYNISGGFAGNNEDFEDGEIQWVFNTKNGQLKVTNKSNDSSIFSGLTTGLYSFSVSTPAGTPILYINGGEFGGLGGSTSGLIINQNKMASGDGADGFKLKFKK